MNRTNATDFFNLDECLAELDRLKFAVQSLSHNMPKGSFERELADNAIGGIKVRLDYMHDSIRLLIKEQSK